MTYGVKDICKRFSVGEHTVLGWIRRGELRAIDVSRQRGGRPRWRIAAEAISAFELARTPRPQLARTRRKPQTNVKRYF